MEADILGQWGAIAAVGSFVVVLGGILLTQVRKFRRGRLSHQAVEEVVIGEPAILSASGNVIKSARPGLIDRMDDMDRWRNTVTGQLARQERKLDKVLDAITPNGGDTTSAGDTLQRTEQEVTKHGKWMKQIAEAVGVPLGEEAS